MKRVLITGISGQDGTLLAELLHARGDKVFGLSMHPPSARVSRVATVHQLDINNAAGVVSLVQAVLPDECYHLAAHHRSSQASINDDTDAYLHTNVLAVQILLLALRTLVPHCRVFLAGSCHMFGSTSITPQNELTPFRPNTPYGFSKVAAAHLGRDCRERHGMFCVNGILYNHESPLRGDSFITTRLARGAVEVARGRTAEVVVGDLDAQVDWGYAGDYVEAMTRALAADQPEDFIIASGELHRVRDFAALAFERVDLDWTRYVKQDPNAHRRVSPAIYQGDITRIRERLSWSPTTSFPSLVKMMVDHYLAQEKT